MRFGICTVDYLLHDAFIHGGNPRRRPLGRGVFLRLHQILSHTFVEFGALSSFVCFPALQDPANNLTCVDVLEGMLVDLSENAHLLRTGIRVVR